MGPVLWEAAMVMDLHTGSSPTTLAVPIQMILPSTEPKQPAMNVEVEYSNFFLGKWRVHNLNCPSQEFIWKAAQFILLKGDNAVKTLSEEGGQGKQSDESVSHLHCSHRALCGKVNGADQLCMQVLQGQWVMRVRKTSLLCERPTCETDLKLFQLLPASLSLSFPWKGLSFFPVQTLESVVQMWSSTRMNLHNMEKTYFLCNWT